MTGKFDLFGVLYALICFIFAYSFGLDVFEKYDVSPSIISIILLFSIFTSGCSVLFLHHRISKYIFMASTAVIAIISIQNFYYWIKSQREIEGYQVDLFEIGLNFLFPLIFMTAFAKSIFLIFDTGDNSKRETELR